MNKFLTEEGSDARLGGVIPFGKPINSKAVALEKGNEDELVEIFAMFDRFQPAKKVTVPPSDDMIHMVR
jgi:hypothetical protein